MDKNLLEIISSEVNSIIDANEKEIAVEEKALEQIDADITSAEKKIDDTFISGDKTAYKKNKKKLEDLTFEKTYHSDRLDKLSKAHLMSKDRYDKLCADLMAYVRSECDKGMSETIAFLNKEREKAISVKSDIDTVNDLLQKLQLKVYRENVRFTNKKGETLIDKRKLRCFGDFEFYLWLTEMTYGVDKYDYQRSSFSELEKQYGHAKK